MATSAVSLASGADAAQQIKRPRVVTQGHWKPHTSTYNLCLKHKFFK